MIDWYSYTSKIKGKIDHIKKESVKQCILANINISKNWRKKIEFNDLMDEISDNKAYKDYITNFSHELNFKNIFEEKIKENNFKYNYKDRNFKESVQLPQKINIQSLKNPSMIEKENLIKKQKLEEKRRQDILVDQDVRKRQKEYEENLLNTENKDMLLDYSFNSFKERNLIDKINNNKLPLLENNLKEKKDSKINDLNTANKEKIFLTYQENIYKDNALINVYKKIIDEKTSPKIHELYEKIKIENKEKNEKVKQDRKRELKTLYKRINKYKLPNK